MNPVHSVYKPLFNYLLHTVRSLLFVYDSNEISLLGVLSTTPGTGRINNVYYLSVTRTVKCPFRDLLEDKGLEVRL